MKTVTTPIQYRGKIINVLRFYGPDDRVLSFELLYGNLNLSKMTFKQVFDTTGITSEELNRIALEVQKQIEREEGNYPVNHDTTNVFV